MIERRQAAKYATPIFYQSFNDFDVYVEDTAFGYVKIFANLLSRALGANIALERVFPLGNRINVIAAAKTELIKANSRKAVFLIDGDLNLLAGENEVLPPNTVCLPRYCIENFLYDEQTLIDIIDEEIPNRSINEIRQSLDYSGWLIRSLEPLKKLFIAFAVARRLGSGLKTVSSGYSSVCLNGTGEIDLHKVDNTVNSMIHNLNSTYGNENVNKAMAFVIEQINNDVCFVSTYVSAKDYSLPLLIIRLRSICGTKAPNINLKMRFSKKCNPDSLASVAESIKKITGLQ